MNGFVTLSIHPLEFNSKTDRAISRPGTSSNADLLSGLNFVPMTSDWVAVTWLDGVGCSVYCSTEVKRG